jgi:hypothetical protein
MGLNPVLATFEGCESGLKAKQMGFYPFELF